MRLHADLDAQTKAVQRIVAVARCHICPVFCDLMWPPAPPVLELWDDAPGVMFESPRRVVVFQRIGGELRYYAGGWCSDQGRIHQEQARIRAEGDESGVFESFADALEFTEQYLIEERSLGASSVSRKVQYARIPQS